MKSITYRPHFVKRDAVKNWSKERPLSRIRNTQPMVPPLEHGARAWQAIDASHRDVKITLPTLKWMREK